MGSGRAEKGQREPERMVGMAGLYRNQAGKREEKAMGWRSLNRGWVRSGEEPQILSEPSIHYAMLVGTSVNYLSWVYFGSDRIQLGVLMMLITGQRTGPCLAYHQGPAQAVDTTLCCKVGQFSQVPPLQKNLSELLCLAAEGQCCPAR